MSDYFCIFRPSLRDSSFEYAHGNIISLWMFGVNY